jgi:hypothetical protein
VEAWAAADGEVGGQSAFAQGRQGGGTGDAGVKDADLDAGVGKVGQDGDDGAGFGARGGGPAAGASASTFGLPLSRPCSACEGSESTDGPGVPVACDTACAAPW